MGSQNTVAQLKRAFRSERILFRALEDNTEDQAFHRAMILEDAASFAFSDRNLFRPQSKEMIEDQFRLLLNCYPLAVVICLESSGSIAAEMTPLGILTLQEHSCRPTHSYHHHRSLELGISIAEEYHDKGYGTEAINWALGWAFRHAGMHTVRLRAFEYNERARHVYQSLGFVLEGKQREQHFHDGKWWDVYLYSITEKEWEISSRTDGA
jgi:RimJ/RimL family protein N-acetyltransferase